MEGVGSSYKSSSCDINGKAERFFQEKKYI